MPPSTFEDGRAALDALAAKFGGKLDRNEATTRLHLIDSLFFEALGWDRSECLVEESYAGSYADYAFGVPARRLIVEAKREGVAFELPAGERTGVLPLRTLLSDPDTAAAVRQALRYAQERGVPFVAIANGHQLATFVANRQDGVPPLEGRALVFTSLEEMRSNFRLLWDNLSREAVGLHALHRTLRDSSLPTPPAKLSERLPNHGRYRIRNRLQTDLKILADLFIEDLVYADESSREEFLLECYSESGALSQYAMLSREILRTRYSAMLQGELEVSAQEVAPKEGSAAFKQDVLAAALARRPIVLLGDVGVGKTIFIQHLMHVGAKDVFGDAITLYVDFLAEPALLADLQQFVARNIQESLLTDYGVDIEERSFVTAVYHGELARFDRGMLGQLKEIDPEAYERERIRFLIDKVNDREAHLKLSLEHIAKGRRKQVVVFLDNIDQRPSEFQEQVYVLAHAVAESWPAAVFVSIRPSTFFASKRTGSLAAYQPRVFTISPPRIDVVLRRRIEYVLKQIRGEVAGVLPADVSLEVSSLSEYLDALLYSIDHNEALVELIDNLSGGNVRRALEFVQTFIGSGNVDTEKMLERIRRSGSFTIDVHQFLRAIILGDYQHFMPHASPIPNIFDLLSPDGREHFLLPLLVAEAERLGSSGSGGEGFVESVELYDFGQAAGFSPAQLEWALERATETGMLEVRSSAGGGSLYRITSIGAYSVRRLPEMFAYLDAVVTDTPIVDPAFRDKITDAHSIDDRLARAELFRHYLDRQWNGLSGQGPSFDWADVSLRARDDIWRIGRQVAGWP